MSSDDIVISVRNLTKTYRIFGHPGDRIKQAATLGLRKYHREFTALKDVSFDIKKGETVGIIGRNGSGKSTLLQLICGILKPTSGTVKVNGRVSALLELGAGFNPEFTGRENVYFQGALMGFTKADMEARFTDIAAFADIGEFIDQPVRTYSSGMFVRLAFAAATHFRPDILAVDEALSVGDAHFQNKCFARMHEIRNAGGTILVVSHAMEQIAHHCSCALLMEQGLLLKLGNVAPVLQHYLATTRAGYKVLPIARAAPSQIEDEPLTRHPAYNKHERRWGNGGAVIFDAHVYQEEAKDPDSIHSGRPLDIVFAIRFSQAVNHPIYGLTIKNAGGTPLFSANSQQVSPLAAETRNPGDCAKARFRLLPFLDEGEYYLSFGVVSGNSQEPEILDRRYDALRVRVAHPASAEFGIDMRPAFALAVGGVA